MSEGDNLNDRPRDPPPPEARRRGRRYLGEILVASGVISPAQLKEALADQKGAKGRRLGRVLLERGDATEAQICESLAEQLRIPAADLVAVDVPRGVLDLIPRELAAQHACLPWFVDENQLYLIMADPTDVAAADAIAFRAGMNVQPVVPPRRRSSRPSNVSTRLARTWPSSRTSTSRSSCRS